MQKIARIKFYFDISCPNSWIAWKTSQTWPEFDLIDLATTCDYKLFFIRLNERREHYNYVNGYIYKKWKKDRGDEAKEKGEYMNGELSAEGSLTKYENNVKPIATTSKFYQMPQDWIETHRKIRNEPGAGIIAAIYLASIQEHRPDLLKVAVDHVGERLWEHKLPILRGCHFSTISREIGLSFRESEHIVSRLQHYRYRQIVEDNCVEAHISGATEAPFFAVHSPSTYRFFNDLSSLDDYLHAEQRRSMER